MCGRYALYATPQVIQETFGLDHFLDYKPHYNIAPGMYLPVITRSGQCDLMKWGFVPHWQVSDQPAYMNARAEDAANKPAFRDAWRTGRCWVMASGFYEWRTIGALKQPYFARFQDDRPFAMAGIWARRGRAESQDLRFAILTQRADGPLRAFHERMPLILPDSASRESWMAEGTYSSCWPTDLILYPVHTRVNHPKHDDAACILPN